MVSCDKNNRNRSFLDLDRPPTFHGQKRPADTIVNVYTIVTYAMKVSPGSRKR